MVGELLNNYFNNSSKVLNSLKEQIENIDLMCDEIQECFKSGNKLLIAGNGGSAADSQHFAGELTCTYKNANRKAYPAVSLSNNPSAYTAWANDFDHKDYFTRQVEALGKEKDILFLISTGGGDLKKGFSINLVRAALYAIQRGIIVFSLVGKSGGELEKISKRSVKVKSDITSHIQEAHISIIHYICETLE